jgi:hypothetical protein
MDAVALMLGFALPWSLGVTLVASLSARASWDEPGRVAWTLGSGWLAGAFVLTLWMRLLAALGQHFGIVAIAGPLAAITVVLAWSTGRRIGAAPIVALRQSAGELAGRRLGEPWRALWLALVAWLGLRFAMLLSEVLWRPLYPWDAWTQWATKARVWFELKTMAPFVNASDWLQAATPSVYFDVGPYYPATVPLTQVWAATVLGRWDDALVNLPWWLTGVAFGLALYGFLARQGFAPLTALVGTWLALSLPIFDVHIALAGYADLAMATYFTVAVLAAFGWIRARDPADGGLALLLLSACIMIKNPGKIWVVTLLPGLLVALLPRYGLRVAAACLGGGAGLAVLLAASGATVLGYRLTLDFSVPWRGLADAYFAFGNWHLLWYGAIAVAILCRRELLSRDLAPLTLVLAAGLLFLALGFVFSNAVFWVEDQSTVNRATLPLAPLIVVWMLLAFRAWTGERPKPGRNAADLGPVTAG